MPVDSTHSEYLVSTRQWQRCRDAIAGSDAIKDGGVRYLPYLSEQTSEEYNAYKSRALWYGASARTLQGLMGAVMRKDPVFTVPEALEPLLADVSLNGSPATTFAKKILGEVLQVGRVGVLVDLPTETDSTPRPYWSIYTAESIINWRTRMIDGVETLVLVVLKERKVSPKPTDFYVEDETQICRVLKIDDEGYYAVELHSLQGNEAPEIIHPTLRGKRLTYIPFCFFGPTTITPAIEKPPLLDLVDVNLSHYRSSADLEHGRHFCGLPTPWVAGFPADKELRIGSSIAWVASDAGAQAGMLEFTGQGLGALEKALETKEQLMAVLGARLLEESKKAVEASDTLEMRYSGEQSVLRSVAMTIGNGLSRVLEWSALWMDVRPEEAKTAVANMNTDFIDAQMSFDQLESLVRSWQAGAMTYQTMYSLMERGEITRPGVTWEDEKEALEVEMPNHVPKGDFVLDGMREGRSS
ncbi:MAG: DUF4055 domain-containing protein [Nitrospira sp.]